MAISRGGKDLVRVARVMKGKCGVCHQMVIAGQAYEYVGGTNTSNQYLAHYNCYKPTNAPTWEELPQVNRLKLGGKQ